MTRDPTISPAPSAAPAIHHGERRRVLIIEDDTLVGMGIKQHLTRMGHEVIGQASRAEDATKLFIDEKPDFALVDIQLDDADGIELATSLLAIRRCPMVIISAYSDKALIDRAGAAGVFGYLIKPVNGASLAAQMEVAYQRFGDQERVLLQNQQLAETLENRKIIEKAKGVFMKRLQLDEQEAHRRLQQESQKRRMSLIDLAKKILESEELLGG